MFLALDTGKKIGRYSWDVIPMPDLVIDRVNTLGSDQPSLLTFTDRHGRLLGDNEIPGVDPPEPIDAPLPEVDLDAVDALEIPGVDEPGFDIETENPAPQIVEITDPDTINTDPPPIEVETVPVAQPAQQIEEHPSPEPSNLRRSTRARSQPTDYTPSMSGSKYYYAVTQFETRCVLNPDAHMFAMDDFYQSDPDVVAAIMTQLSTQGWPA